MAKNIKKPSTTPAVNTRGIFFGGPKMGKQ